MVVDLTEKEWDAQLFNTKKGLAPQLGWQLTYHTLRSKGSASGFPDRILIRERLIAVELKKQKGKPTPTQVEWLDGLAKAGVETYLWQPDDYEEIARILSRRWLKLPSRHELAIGHEIWTPRSLWIAGAGRADQQQTLHKETA